MAYSVQAGALFVIALVGLVQATGPRGCDGGACAATEDAEAMGVSLLMHGASRLKKGQEEAKLSHDAQKHDQKQNSTGQNCYDGTACYGNQCCPGDANTRGQTYPCPTASPGFTGCQVSYYPTPSPTPHYYPTPSPYDYPTPSPYHYPTPTPYYPTPSPSPGPTWCTYGNTQCAGDQCCPAVQETGWKTYPCPSNPYFNGCASSTPYPSPYPSPYPTPTPSPPQSSVPCYYYPTGTYGTGYCTPNSCCQGIRQSQWQTYPCYTSSPGFLAASCQTGNKRSLLQAKDATNETSP